MTPSILLNQEFQKISKLNCWPFPEFLILSSSTSSNYKAENILQSNHRISNESSYWIYLESLPITLLHSFNVKANAQQATCSVTQASCDDDVFLHLSFYIHLLQEYVFWNFSKIFGFKILICGLRGCSTNFADCDLTV